MNGYVSSSDPGVFHHFWIGGCSTIEWVEIWVSTPDQDAAVETALRQIHVPGHRVEHGFRVYGYTADGEAINYI